ncbi:MAG TPA: AsmA family protein, partial [Candidatus Sumerlaeota bacterium]|nr:AsmA family protein [Candidatus Sumerlaeota bacterium]
MADKKGTNETKARRSWGKIFFRIGILLTLIAVVGYFVLTSSAFLQGVVLPRVGRTLNSKLEASDVDFSPLTRLALQDVKITPDNAAELLTAKLVRVRYSLLDILRDNIHVEEITMDSPVINLVLNADGTSNLDPLLTALAGGKSHGDTDVQTPHDPSGAKKVAIKSITLKNATLRQTRNFSPGERTIAEINSLNLTATDIRNGAGGKLDFSSSLFLDKAVTSTKLSSIQAMLNG